MWGREQIGRSEAHESAAQATVVEPAVASYQSASGVRYPSAALLTAKNCVCGAHRAVLMRARARARVCVCFILVLWWVNAGTASLCVRDR